MRVTVLIAIEFAFCSFVLAGVAAKAQQTATTPNESESLIYSLKGPDLFRAYCASCHGVGGKGDGA
jgi:mono/diheme cytochrome c family protein